MTTYTIEGYSFRNPSPNPNGENDFVVTSLTFSGSADLGVSYSILVDPPNAYPDVSFSASQGTLDHVSRDGVILDASN